VFAAPVTVIVAVPTLVVSSEYRTDIVADPTPAPNTAPEGDTEATAELPEVHCSKFRNVVGALVLSWNVEPTARVSAPGERTSSCRPLTEAWEPPMAATTGAAVESHAASKITAAAVNARMLER